MFFIHVIRDTIYVPENLPRGYVNVKQNIVEMEREVVYISTGKVVRCLMYNIIENAEPWSGFLYPKVRI